MKDVITHYANKLYILIAGRGFRRYEEDGFYEIVLPLLLFFLNIIIIGTDMGNKTKIFHSFIIAFAIISLLSLLVIFLHTEFKISLNEIKKSEEFHNVYTALGFVDKDFSSKISDYSPNKEEIIDIIFSCDWYGYGYQSVISEKIYEYHLTNDTLIIFFYEKEVVKDESYKSYFKNRKKSYKKYSKYYKYEVSFEDNNYIILNNINSNQSNCLRGRYELILVNNKMSLIIYPPDDFKLKTIWAKNLILFAEKPIDNNSEIEKYKTTSLFGYSIGDLINDSSNLKKSVYNSRNEDDFLTFSSFVKNTKYGTIKITTINNVITQLHLTTIDQNTVEYFVDFLNKKFDTNYSRRNDRYSWNGGNVLIVTEDYTHYSVIVYDKPIRHLIYSSILKDCILNLKSSIDEKDKIRKTIIK